MGKYLDKFKKHTEKAGKKAKQLEDSGKFDRKENINEKRFHHKKRKEEKDIYDEFEEDYEDKWENNIDENEVGIQPSQKPESFHHFILENQYKDLERSIRGLKDVWDKDTQRWKTKRKELHCFTDEEAEDILRTAQSHLATDVKLGWIKMEVFGDYMNALYKELSFLFESIAEYRYGRYNNKNGSLNYEKQYQMKVQNQKIFLELWTRVQANYSRSINGTENKLTHESVKGQESLQNTERDQSRNRRYS